MISTSHRLVAALLEDEEEDAYSNDDFAQSPEYAKALNASRFSRSYFDSKVDFGDGESRFKNMPYSGVSSEGFAAVVARDLGPARVKIYSSTQYGPSSEIGEGRPHAFAVVDDRYLVDGCAQELFDAERVVYDLVDEAELVRKIYGDPARWKRDTYCESVAADDRDYTADFGGPMDGTGGWTVAESLLENEDDYSDDEFSQSQEFKRADRENLRLISGPVSATLSSRVSRKR